MIVADSSGEIGPDGGGRELARSEFKATYNVQSIFCDQTML